MKLLSCCVIIFVVQLWNACASESDTPSTNIADLTLTIQCTNAVFKMGDEIPIDFVISNCGTTNYTYDNRTYDRSGRMGEYEISVKTADGKMLPTVSYGGFSGGLFGYATLHPGEFFTKTIPANLWSVPPSAGQYSVTGIYHGNIGTNWSSIRSIPITVTILPRTETEMDAYIHDLTNHAGVDWMKLAFTGSPQIVPFLLNGMYHGGDSFWIGKALVGYLPHMDSIKQQMIEAALKSGLVDNMVYVFENYNLSEKEWASLISRSLREDSSNTWEAGARAVAPGHYDDAFTPRLIAIATEKSGASGQAIWALAMNRTDASVETLKTLLNSPDKDIRLTTEKAICVAYCYRGYYHGQKLKPEDFDKKFQNPSTYLDLVQEKSNP